MSNRAAASGITRYLTNLKMSFQTIKRGQFAPHETTLSINGYDVPVTCEVIGTTRVYGDDDSYETQPCIGDVTVREAVEDFYAGELIDLTDDQLRQVREEYVANLRAEYADVLQTMPDYDHSTP